MFQDRTEAGRKLAERLVSYKTKDPVVIALPRGGVPVAYEVAWLLGAPLDIVIVRKLGFPGQPDFAVGAIADGGNWEVIFNDDLYRDVDLSSEYIEHEIAAKREEIHAMGEMFRSHRRPVNITGRTVIAVDDGVATGATMRVALKRLRRDNPKKIIVATPVASREAVNLLKKEADSVICLDIPYPFVAVGNFYEDFQHVSSEEVIRFLDQAREPVDIIRKAV